MTVIVGARNEERGRKAAAELGSRYVHLDVTDEESIRAAAAWIERECGVLDILVNNAGIIVWAEDMSPSATSLADLRRTYETNVFGAVAVTNAMLPLLRRSAAGRIVNVSSSLGSLARAAGPEGPHSGPNALAYNSSKTALNMITLCYARELRDTPIKVNAVDPGYCATDLNGHSGTRTAEQGAQIAIRMALLGPDGPTGTYQSDEGIIPW